MNAKPSQKLKVDNVPLRQMVTYRLTRLNAKMNAQAAKILKRTAGISQTQWRVMMLVTVLGPVSSARMAREIVMDKGQLSRTVKSMAANGMIRVEGSESDQRAHVISLTGSGRELFERARPAMRDRQARLADSLTREEQEILFRALEKLEHLADE